MCIADFIDNNFVSVCTFGTFVFCFRGPSIDVARLFNLQISSEMSWPWLPVDIYVDILIQLPVAHDDSTIKTLIACSQATSQLRSATVISNIWKPHYRALYVHSVENREIERKATHRNDWRLMTLDRLRLDSKAFKLLDDIVQHSSDRTSRARSVCSLSFDVWDSLNREAVYQLPPVFSDSANLPVTSETRPRGLARRFWAKHLTGLIARRDAINIWRNCLFRDDTVLDFEQALAGLSSFFGSTSTHVSESSSYILTCVQSLRTDRRYQCNSMPSAKIVGRTLLLLDVHWT